MQTYVIDHFDTYLTSILHWQSQNIYIHTQIYSPVHNILENNCYNVFIELLCIIIT